MEIVLASQSPRRRELLERLGGKNFRIVTPDIDEHMERELPPEELVRRISAEKARAVREQAGMDEGGDPASPRYGGGPGRGGAGQARG